MRVHLEAACLPALPRSVERHDQQVPYTLFQRPPCGILASLRGSGLPWNTLQGVRSWMRLRAGVVTLRSLHGRASKAKHQSCIFCSLRVRNGTVHVLSRCQCWAREREEYTRRCPTAGGRSPGELALSILGCQVSCPAFAAAVALAVAVDRGATDFWKRQAREE